MKNPGKLHTDRDFAFQKPFRASGVPVVANNNGVGKIGYHDAKLKGFLKTPAARKNRR